MSLREAYAGNLARNLARLCDRDESIAAVCRATKINRQQFAKYLAGQSVPSAENRRKICRHFKISEQELFRSPDAFRAPANTSKTSLTGRKASWSHGEIGAVLKLLYSDARPSISPGIYFVHFSEIQDKRSVVRSLLIVRNDDNLTTFRRLTGISERKGSWWGQFLGDHRGVVIERAHWLYFVGLNARGVLEPSMMVLRWLSGARPLFGGYAMVNAAGGPTPIAVVVSPCDLRLRQAVQAAHVYSSDDPALDPLVVEALEEQTKLLAAKTGRIDLRVRRRGKEPP
jgi:transcriptional regulator with XRE-family HTH domain